MVGLYIINWLCKKYYSLEEARSRHLIGGGVGGSGIGNVGVPATAGSTSSSIPIHHQSAAHRHHGGYIEVGGGPSSLPDKYHTILPLPRGWHKRASKRSPTGWRALFTRGNTGSSKVDGQGGDAVKRDNEVDGGLIGTDTATVRYSISNNMKFCELNFMRMHNII